MPVKFSAAGMIACVLVWAFAGWREKKKQLGDVPLVPHLYIKFFALILFLVFAADFISGVTGVTWQSPFRR